MGLTLIEITVAMAVIALVCGVVGLQLSGISHSDLRQSSRRLQTVIRRTYFNAVLTGQTYRLKLTVGAPNLELTRSSSNIRLADDSNQVEDLAGHVVGRPNAQVQAKRSRNHRSLGVDSNKLGYVDWDANNLAGALLGSAAPFNPFAAAEFGDSEVLRLVGSVVPMDATVEGNAVVISEGDVYLFLFPNGVTTAATLHLQDSSKSVYTVQVAAYAGKVTVFPHYVAAPRL